MAHSRMPHLTVTAWVSMPNLPVAPNPTYHHEQVGLWPKDTLPRRSKSRARQTSQPGKRGHRRNQSEVKTSHSTRQTSGCHHPHRRRQNKRSKTSPLNVLERARKIEILDSAYLFTPSKKAKTKSKKLLKLSDTTDPFTPLEGTGGQFEFDLE